MCAQISAEISQSKTNGGQTNMVEAQVSSSGLAPVAEMIEGR